MLTNLSNKKLSFLITFIYVLLATIHLYNKTTIPMLDIILYFIFILAEVFPFLILYYGFNMSNNYCTNSMASDSINYIFTS